MPGSESELRELDQLRRQLNEYEAALRSAAPRLAAFKRLEHLARDQGTSPEAIASQAAVEVMKREKDALVTLLAGLANERDQLKGEVAMLLINKTEAGRAVSDLHVEREELNIEVAEIVDHLAQIRQDAVRLLSDRSELSVEVSALREEVRALHDAFQQIERARAEQDRSIEERNRRHAGNDLVSDDPAPDAVFGETGVVSETGVLVETALLDTGFDGIVVDHPGFDPVVNGSLEVVADAGFIAGGAIDDESAEVRMIPAEAEELAAELEANKSAKQRREVLVPRRTNAESIATDDETEALESQAFDAFFHAEIDHDKARDWILG